MYLTHMECLHPLEYHFEKEAPNGSYPFLGILLHKGKLSMSYFSVLYLRRNRHSGNDCNELALQKLWLLIIAIELVLKTIYELKILNSHCSTDHLHHELSGNMAEAKLSRVCGAPHNCPTNWIPTQWLDLFFFLR